MDDQIQRSLAWSLVRESRRVRTILFRDGRFSERCWRAFSRFTKVAMTQGIGVAVAKARARIKHKFGRTMVVASPVEEPKSVREAPRPFASFCELPWWDIRGSVPQRVVGRQSYKLLMVSHEASRTGAPLCMLRLAEQLVLNSDLECWVVLDRGGELVEEFARAAPTLIVETLPHHGITRDQAPDLIAAFFREYADSGVAICNTACVGQYYAACAEHHVPVLAWVHEMPTSIDWLPEMVLVSLEPTVRL